MVDTVTAREIRALAKHEGLCVSLCIPTSAVGRDRMQGRIRLRNQIEKAHGMLVEQGMRSTLAWDFLEPASALLSDPEFWESQSNGLAIYIADGILRIIHLEEAPEELGVVGKHFHIRPLIDAASGTGVFILALDENRTSLYFARGEHIRELEVPELPRTMAEAIGPEYSEKQRQMHSVGPAGRGGSVSHGAGDRAADDKDRALRYCQAVDRALTRFLARSQVPLVLAADEPNLSIFQHVNRYPHLDEEAIVGSPHRLPVRELAHRAQAIQSNKRARREEEWLERHTALKAQGKAGNDPALLLREAEAGRVEVLLASHDAHKWGLVLSDGSIQPLDGPQPGAEDLINLAEIKTLENGGSVVEVHQAQEAVQTGAAALFRY